MTMMCYICILIVVFIDIVRSQTWSCTTDGLNGGKFLWNTVASSLSGEFLVAGIKGGALYTSNNSATNWNLYNSTLTNTASWNSVAISGTGQYMIGGSSDGLFLSSNYGKSFSIPTNLTGIYFWEGVTMSLNGTYMVGALCCDSGGIYYSTNSGITWSQSSKKIGNWISVDSNANGDYMYAIDSRTGLFKTTGILFFSTNYGKDWAQSTAATDTKFKSLTLSKTGQYVAIVSTYDGIIISSDYGSTWKTSSGANNISWNAIITDSAGEYYVAVGDNTTTYSSYDYGASFVNNNPTTTLGDATSITSNGTFSLLVISTSNSGLNNPAGIYTSENWLVLQPTPAPTNPTSQPTSKPSIPTGQPSSLPTNPTSHPSTSPSRQPSGQPSTSPTRQPSGQPSTSPTSSTRQPSSNSPPYSTVTPAPTSATIPTPTPQPSSVSQPLSTKLIVVICSVVIFGAIILIGSFYIIYRRRSTGQSIYKTNVVTNERLSNRISITTTSNNLNNSLIDNKARPNRTSLDRMILSNDTRTLNETSNPLSSSL